MLADARLRDKRVLVVEDEAMVALGLVVSLEDLGAIILGPAYDLASALTLAQSAQVDCAILDFRIGSSSVLPVAEVLQRRRVPFIFATGLADLRLPPHLRASISLNKPFGARELTSALTTAMSAEFATA